MVPPQPDCWGPTETIRLENSDVPRVGLLIFPKKTFQSIFYDKVTLNVRKLFHLITLFFGFLGNIGNGNIGTRKNSEKDTLSKRSCRQKVT